MGLRKIVRVSEKLCISTTVGHMTPSTQSPAQTCLHFLPEQNHSPKLRSSHKLGVTVKSTYGYQRHKVRCRRPLCRSAHPRGRPRHPAAQLCGHIACMAPHGHVRVLLSSPEATSSSEATLKNEAGKVMTMLWYDIINGWMFKRKALRKDTNSVQFKQTFIPG